MLSDLGYFHNRWFLRLITVITLHRKLSAFGCPNARTSSSNPTAFSSVVMLSCVDTGLLIGPYSVQIRHSQNLTVQGKNEEGTRMLFRNLGATYQTPLRQINQDSYHTILTYLLTPWCRVLPEKLTFAASQEIPRISRNSQAHYRTHKRPPSVSILGQPNPVHIPTSHHLQIHPNIIHPSTPRSPQWSLSLRFPHQDPIHPLSSPIRATCPAHLILLDFITRTILGEEYKSFSSHSTNPPYSPTRFFFFLKRFHVCASSINQASPSISVLTLLLLLSFLPRSSCLPCDISPNLFCLS